MRDDRSSVSPRTITSTQQERGDYFQNAAPARTGYSPFHRHSAFSSSTSIDQAALRSRAVFASPGSRPALSPTGSAEEATAATNALDTWADPDDLKQDRVDLEIERLFGGPESERQRTHRPKIVTAMNHLVGHRHPSQDLEHGMPALRRHSFFGQLSQEEEEDDPNARKGSVSFAPDPRNPKSTSAEGKRFDPRPKLEKLHSSLLSSKQESRRITRHNESSGTRRKFILKLAKALLSYGAPSHRIESQLFAASKILEVKASFAYLPNIVLVSFNDGDTRTTELHFVRSSGRIALTSLHKVHDVYRDVLHDDVGTAAGTEALERILRSPPIYPLYTRCLLAFVCASVICPLAFGGSFIDMWVSGSCACVLQYLGLQAAAKSSIYANVYEISVSIIVSLIARVLSCIPGKLFCYSSISSAGVVLILPGFTILISALELTSRNILCGSVRLVYAIIYTFFLGFGLTIGSDIFLMIDDRAHHRVQTTAIPQEEYYHGEFLVYNATAPIKINGTFGFSNVTNAQHVSKGCFHDPNWPWYRKAFPWWTMLFLVPLYSTCSSLSNLQSFRSSRLPIMVVFSCCSYAVNKAATLYLADAGTLASAAGALVIGLLGNFYSRFVGGTAFTSMVTGVLFLVPSGLAQAGGLTSNYNSSAQQYWSSFTLGLRMIQVAIGVTIGLFVSQSIVYAFGGRKKAGTKFAF